MGFLPVGTKVGAALLFLLLLFSQSVLAADFAVGDADVFVKDAVPFDSEKLLSASPVLIAGTGDFTSFEVKNVGRISIDKYYAYPGEIISFNISHSFTTPATFSCGIQIDDLVIDDISVVTVEKGIGSRTFAFFPVTLGVGKTLSVSMVLTPKRQVQTEYSILCNISNVLVDFDPVITSPAYWFTFNDKLNDTATPSVFLTTTWGGSYDYVPDARVTNSSINLSGALLDKLDIVPAQPFNVSLAVWVKNNSLLSNRAIYLFDSKAGPAVGCNAQESFYIGANGVAYLTWSGQTITTIANYPTDGAWHHLTFVQNTEPTASSPVNKIYIDGVLKNTTYGTGAAAPTGYKDLRINGQFQGGSSSCGDDASATAANVTLADYRIFFNDTLSADQVREIYYDGAGYPNGSVNLQILSELTQTIITGTAFSVKFTSDTQQFNYTTSDGTLIAVDLIADNYSVDVVSVSSLYPSKRYYVAVYNSSVNSLNAYMLNSSQGDYIVFNVKNQLSQILEDASVMITKQFNSSFTTVEQRRTDFSGAVRMYMNAQTEYKMLISYPGYLLREATVTPTTTPYTVYLQESSAATVSLWNEVNYNTKSNVSDSGATNFSLAVISPSGVLSSFAVVVTANGTEYSDVVTTSPSGGTAQLNLNLSNYTGLTVTVDYSICSDTYGCINHTINVRNEPQAPLQGLEKTVTEDIIPNLSNGMKMLITSVVAVCAALVTAEWMGGMFPAMAGLLVIVGAGIMGFIPVLVASMIAFLGFMIYIVFGRGGGGGE